MRLTPIENSRGTGYLMRSQAPRANPVDNPFQVADSYTEKIIVGTLMAIDALSYISPFRWLPHLARCGTEGVPLESDASGPNSIPELTSKNNGEQETPPSSSYGDENSPDRGEPGPSNPQAGASDAGPWKLPGRRISQPDADANPYPDAHPYPDVDVDAGSEFARDGGNVRNDGGGSSVECPPSNEILRVIANPVTENDHDTSRNPSLVASGGEYGVSWQDGRHGLDEIYFARIGADGVKIGNDIRITHNVDDWFGDTVQPSLAWTGSEYGLAWVDARGSFPSPELEIYFARLDQNGIKISETRITNFPNGYNMFSSEKQNPFLVWNGMEYGLTWSDNREGGGLFFARIARDGSKIGEDVRVSNTGFYPYHATPVWNGVEYGLSWYNSVIPTPSIFFGRVSGMGEKIGEDILIETSTLEIDKEPEMVWTGEDYAMIWDRSGHNPSPPETPSPFYLRQITREGERIGEDRELVRGATPHFVWTGNEYGIVWSYGWNRFAELHFGRFDRDGNIIGETVQITNDENASYLPDLVWNEQAREYALSWMDGPYENGAELQEIRFAQIQIVPCD